MGGDEGRLATDVVTWKLRVPRFSNLDKLIHYANLDGRVNAFYSTPAIYAAAKNTYNTTWPLKEDDFFPYADCPTCYWTGAGFNSLSKYDLNVL